MSEIERFDLPRFVLGFLEHEGSLVTPPVFGAHEVLLPDELAAELGVEAYLKLRFDNTAEQDPDPDSVRISFNHPLVESIAERVRHQPGHVHVYVNHLRLNKTGLFETALREISLPDARLTPKHGVMEQRALHHYLRCNFKVTFLSDEKQEVLIPVVLDVQAGNVVQSAEVLERLRTVETEPGYPHMSIAPPRWAGAGDAVSEETFQALLPKAQAGLEEAIRPRVAAMEERAARYLAQDQDRIAEYYDSLEADLRRRQERLAPSEVERRASNEQKLAALQAERLAKLADAESRYQLRVELELVNVQVIVQPKLLLPVEIGNRRTTITRAVVWDPLVHQLEQLLCDVCGQPGNGLHLCLGGHLAHADCLAPQCIDCKRVYCQLCAEQVQACVVCKEPVCRASLTTCEQCGGQTCRTHVGQCHGNVAVAEPNEHAEPASASPSTGSKAHDKQDTAGSMQRQMADRSTLGKVNRSNTRGRATPSRSSSQRGRKGSRVLRKSKDGPTRLVKGVKINVDLYQDRPAIVAFVMRSTSKVLATRFIELRDDGIHVNCRCEKEECPSNGWIHYPAHGLALEKQLQRFLNDLRKEYHIPTKRVNYFMAVGDQGEPVDDFVLMPSWQDEERLQSARQEFERR